MEDVRNATDSAIFTITIKLNSDSTPLVFNVDMKEKTNSEPTLLRVNNNPNYYIVYFHYKTNETTISIIKKIDPRNWMSKLPSSLYLDQLTIPGTHDSSTYTLPTYIPILGAFIKTQFGNISTQLNDGIRFFDIRVQRVERDRGFHKIDTRWKLVHGPISLGADFDSILDGFAKFLKTNPSETIIVSIKEDKKSKGNVASMDNIFLNYQKNMPNLIWYKGGAMPNLYDIRGKIVLLRRFKSTLSEGIDASDWADNTTFTTHLLRVQDIYNTSKHDKQEAINSFIDEAMNNNSNFLYINFTSSDKGCFRIPVVCMLQTMPSVWQHVSKMSISSRLGIIPLDFYDPLFVEYLINTNQFN